MVTRAIVHEMESSLGPDLEAAMVNELGNPECLDGFVPNPRLRGETMAVGPELVGGIVSANIPALPHLTVMRSLLTKSPCIVKTAAAEPHFLPAYARSLFEVDPEVGRHVAVVGFGHEHAALLEAFLEHLDFLIAYGGPEAMAALRSRVGPGVRTLFHGHRLGFCLLARDAPSDPGLAGNVALDTVLFDQEACLAPHVAFVEADFDTACVLAQQVAREMDRLHDDYPLGHRPLAWKLSVRHALDEAAMDPGRRTRVFPAGSVERGVVLVQELARFEASPLGRFLRVVPVESLDHALDIVRPLSGLLQNASIAASPDRRRTLAAALAALGVSRVCPPGNMGTPSMMWHHDGQGCLAAMVRFTDWEVRRSPPLSNKSS
jgi:hypothetical protein